MKKLIAFLILSFAAFSSFAQTQINPAKLLKGQSGGGSLFLKTDNSGNVSWSNDIIPEFQKDSIKLLKNSNTFSIRYWNRQNMAFGYENPVANLQYTNGANWYLSAGDNAPNVRQSYHTYNFGYLNMPVADSVFTSVGVGTQNFAVLSNVRQSAAVGTDNFATVVRTRAGVFLPNSGINLNAVGFHNFSDLNLGTQSNIWNVSAIGSQIGELATDFRDGNFIGVSTAYWLRTGYNTNTFGSNSAFHAKHIRNSSFFGHESGDGLDSLHAITNAQDITGVGYRTAFNRKSSIGLTAVGANAAYGASDIVSYSDYSTYLGYQPNYLGSGNNSTYVGGSNGQYLRGDNITSVGYFSAFFLSPKSATNLTVLGSLVANGYLDSYWNTANLDNMLLIGNYLKVPIRYSSSQDTFGLIASQTNVWGNIAFKGTASGITPTASAHLATKGYVDALDATSIKSNSNVNWTGGHAFFNDVTLKDNKQTLYYNLGNTAYYSISNVGSTGSTNSFLDFTSNNQGLHLRLSTGLATFYSAVSSNSTVTGTQLISSVATGTKPINVTSTTLVDNLNAQYLNGFASSAFGQLSGSNNWTGNNAFYVTTQLKDNTQLLFNNSGNTAYYSISNVGSTGSTNSFLDFTSNNQGLHLRLSTGSAAFYSAVSSNSTFSGTRLISSVATGTAPLTVASTTLVTNLNANFIQGLDSNVIAQRNAVNAFTENATFAKKVGIGGAADASYALNVTGSLNVTVGVNVANQLTTNSLTVTGAALNTTNTEVLSIASNVVSRQNVKDLEVATYQAITLSALTADVGGGVLKHLLTLDCAGYYQKAFKVNMTNNTATAGTQITFSNMKAGGDYTVVYYSNTVMPLQYDSSAKLEDGSTNFSVISQAGAFTHRFRGISTSAVMKAF